MSTLTSRNAKKIADQLGKQKTLAHGLSSFVYCNPLNFLPFAQQKQERQRKKKILFLGLGYNALEDTQVFTCEAEEIYAFEFEDFSKACAKENIEITLPQNAIQLDEDELFDFFEKENLNELAIYIYRQNLSLFPSYWNSLFLKVESILKNRLNLHVINSGLLSAKNTQDNKKNVFFASFINDLMHEEVKDALKENGYECIRYIPNALEINNFSIQQISENSFAQVKEIIQNTKLELFLSVNGRFLDTNGRIYSLLEHLKIPLALWIVDNPWNILSAFKSDFWKECYLFVTDSSFIPKLQEYGAKHVHYLPLAGSIKTRKYSEMARNDSSEIELLYVGSSAFKGKDSFYSAVNKDNIVLQQMLKKENLPNFHTIYEEILLSRKINLWGADDFREISYLSSEVDICNKIKWLENLHAQFGTDLTIIGDEGWNSYLDKVNILPPVDYYTALPSYYKKAKYTLNIPSMLMPNALTQRHFDVWLAGGFLLSAPTDGLEIFSSSAQDIMLVTASDKAVKKMEYLNLNESTYNTMKKYMREQIEATHLYKHRVATIKECIGLL